MAAYLGETGLRQRSDTSPAATIRAWSKPPGYMALLVPVIVYSGYFVPWLVQQLNTIALGNSTAGADLPDLNTTGMEPASAPMAVGGLPPEADWTVTSARTALAAMAGVPLILGFMLRNQLFSQQIESALVGINRWWHGGATAASAETQDDDSVVSFSDPSSEDVREEDDVVIFFDGRPDLSDDESSSADADAFKDRPA